MPSMGASWGGALTGDEGLTAFHFLGDAPSGYRQRRVEFLEKIGIPLTKSGRELIHALIWISRESKLV